MSRREMTRTLDLVMRTWGPRVNEAALPFEARWTRRALRFHSAKLADAFEQALTDFGTAMDSGTSTEIESTGGRLCRAYAVIAAELATAKVPDDAYMIGRDQQSGLKVAIATSPAAGKRAKQVHPSSVWFSPDEVAALFALDERAQKIAASKAAFPGAEISSINNGGNNADTDQA